MFRAGRRLIRIGSDRHPAEDRPIARRHVLIAGATATGKSDLAMRQAAEIGGVIVNADSQQLYDGLRILTARPSEADEASAPHRLYGVADPSESWSVGRWLQAVEALLAQEQRPLVIVGGTGLYFHALLKGLAPVPDVEPSLRQAVEAEYAVEGEVGARRRLAEVDPQAESRIARGDRQRLIRALSVFLATGRSLSEWRAQTSPPLVPPGSYEGWVAERGREALYARCDRRVDAMIRAGALGEVEALLARKLAPNLPAMLAVGMRELAAVVLQEQDLDDAVAQTKLATRHYAKRQLTWFRNQASDWPRWPALSD